VTYYSFYRLDKLAAVAGSVARYLRRDCWRCAAVRWVQRTVLLL